MIAIVVIAIASAIASASVVIAIAFAIVSVSAGQPRQRLEQLGLLDVVAGRWLVVEEPAQVLEVALGQAPEHRDHHRTNVVVAVESAASQDPAVARPPLDLGCDGGDELLPRRVAFTRRQGAVTVAMSWPSAISAR